MPLQLQGDEEGSKKLQEMEEELAKLKAMQEKVKMEVSSGQEVGTAAGAVQGIEAREEVDGRSIYVGNVDYGKRERERERILKVRFCYQSLDRKSIHIHVRRG